MAWDRSEKRVDLVFQGGGVKAIGLVGAYSVLEESGFRPHNMAGTSAGAIVAVLVAAGYRGGELHQMMGEVDFELFLDRDWKDRIPVAGAPISIMFDQGIYEGNALLGWLRTLLADKGVQRFGDLVLEDSASDPLYRYKVQVIASDVTARRMLVLPRDARVLGIDPDDLDVALAVRMSAGIPLFFEPVRHAAPDGEHVIVDGGMLSNFPVWLFDSETEPAWPTFGLKLVSPNPQAPVTPAGVGRAWNPLGETVDYLAGLVSTMIEAHDKLYLENAEFVRTITIPNLGIRATQFDLAPEEAEALYVEGRVAAEQFLRAWDFGAYVQQFRSSKPRSRRREVSEHMRRASDRN